MISNSNMAAIPIWGQFQFGGNSNMAAIPIYMAPKRYGSHHGMPNHSTKYNYYMTDSYIEISATTNKTNEQIDTHIKLGFYGIPGSVIHLTKKRLNYQTKKISFTVTRTIIETWIQIGLYQKPVMMLYTGTAKHNTLDLSISTLLSNPISNAAKINLPNISINRQLHRN